MLGTATQNLDLVKLFLLLEDQLLQNLLIFTDQEGIYFAIELIFDSARHSRKGFGVGHLFYKIFLAEMDYDFFDAVFKDFVFATYVEIIQKVFFTFCDIVLFRHKNVYVFEILVNVELLPEHCRKLHR